MKNLYQANLMDHYQNPRNRGALYGANFSSGKQNPSCGDSIAIEGIMKNGMLEASMFEGSGCVISQATASILSEKLIGMSRKEIVALDAQAVQDMIGMQLGLTRLKCALLPLEAIQNGVKNG